MSNRRVLITGASGFIGTALRTTVAATWPDAEIIAVDRRPSAGVVEADLLDPDAIDAVVAECKPTHVLHMAGVIRSADWAFLYESNIQTTVNLFEALGSQVPGCRVVIPGSAAEYGAVPEVDLPVLETRVPYPISPYGVAKLWQSSVARFYATRDLHVVVGRVFNISGRGVPPTFSIGAVVEQLKAIRDGAGPAQIEVGDTATWRDFLDLSDVCAALVLLAEAGAAGEIYNVCSGDSVRIGDVFDRLIEFAGIDVELVSNVRPPRMGDIPVSYGSNEKICIELGWKPRVSLDESLRLALL